jgi:drug/metabolite transporter (DMT)-like permease
MGDLRGRALWAYITVCIVWGSTYLAIRVGVESLPPFLLAGVRFLIAGGLLALWARFRKDPLPATPREWRTLAIVGILLLLGGNGLVVWAEQYVDSGAASVFVVTVVIWTAAFDALIPGGKTRFSWQLVGGLLLGLLGAAILTGVGAESLRTDALKGPVALLLASGSWALGSVYLKRRGVGVSATTASAVQMLAGGLALTVVGAALGEGRAWHPTREGLAALAYLIVLGSIVGFTAYGYALRHASATIVGTYAYVNPVVAVFLGWLLLDEPLGARKLLAMAAILAAVIWIQQTVTPKQPAPRPVSRRVLPRTVERSVPRGSSR